MSFPIPGYPQKTVIQDPDLFVIEDVASGNTKHVTREDLLSSAPLPADTVDRQAIEAEAVGTDELGGGAATPDKRSGGFKAGLIAAATFGSTGNKSITGVGFQPKLVKFFLSPEASSSVMRVSEGLMTESFSRSTAVGASSSSASTNRSASAFFWINPGSSGSVMRFNYESMDADGFTIDVVVADSSFGVYYEAYA